MDSKPLEESISTQSRTLHLLGANSRQAIVTSAGNITRDESDPMHSRCDIPPEIWPYIWQSSKIDLEDWEVHALYFTRQEVDGHVRGSDQGQGQARATIVLLSYPHKAIIIKKAPTRHILPSTTSKVKWEGQLHVGEKNTPTMPN